MERCFDFNRGAMHVAQRALFSESAPLAAFEPFEELPRADVLLTR